MASHRKGTIRCSEGLAKYSDAFGWNTRVVDVEVEQKGPGKVEFTQEWVLLFKRRLLERARECSLTHTNLVSTLAKAAEEEDGVLTRLQLRETLIGLQITLTNEEMDCVMQRLQFKKQSGMRMVKVVDTKRFVRKFLPRHLLQPHSHAFIMLRRLICVHVVHEGGTLDSLLSNDSTIMPDEVFHDRIKNRMQIRILQDELDAVTIEIRIQEGVVDVEPLIDGLRLLIDMNIKLAESGELSQEIASLLRGDGGLTGEGLSAALEKLGLTLTEEEKDGLLEHLEEAEQHKMDLVVAATRQWIVECVPSMIGGAAAGAVRVIVKGVEAGNNITLTAQDTTGGKVESEYEASGDKAEIVFDSTSLSDGDIEIKVGCGNPEQEAVTSAKKCTAPPSAFTVTPSKEFLNQQSAKEFTLAFADCPDKGTYRFVGRDCEGNETKGKGKLTGSTCSSDIIPTSGLADGDVKFQLWVTDEFGNESEMVEVGVEKQSKGPEGYSMSAQVSSTKDIDGMRLADSLTVDVNNLAADGGEILVTVIDEDAGAVNVKHQATSGEAVQMSVDIGSLAATGVTVTVTVADKFGNQGNECVQDVERVLGTVPPKPNVVYATRHGNNLDVYVSDGRGPPTLATEHHEITMKSSDGQNGDVQVESGDVLPITHELIGEGLELDVGVCASNALGKGEAAEVHAFGDQVLMIEMEIGGWTKLAMDRDHQKEVKNGLASVLQECLGGPDFVTVVAVTDVEGEDTAVGLEVEFEPSCLVEPSVNFEQFEEVKKKADAIKDKFHKDGFEEVEWVRFTGALRKVTYARTGWLQVKVLRGVDLFADRMEREAHLELELGKLVRKTKNLAVFREEATEWNQRFEFEHVHAKQQTLVFRVCSKKKQIEECSLDMVRNLYPGISEVNFQAACGTIVFECTWHPRSQADRDVSRKRHVVTTGSKASDN